MIRPVEASDIPRLAAIYNHYILHTVVSFEEEPVSAAEMGVRIEATTSEGWWGSRLYERLGFTKTAHFKEVGFKLGSWVDVGYWQRVL